MMKVNKKYYILLGLVLLTSCTIKTQSYDWGWSLEECKDKLGVRYYNPVYGYCRCNNGEVIRKEGR